MTRLTRDDIVAGAGRRFAEYGYHGTSMRDLGDDLGILGSSIYAHVGGKQELFVAVVDRGAAFFAESAERASALGTDPLDTLRLLISGHIDVILDHRSEARTYLAEAPFLDDSERGKVTTARKAYEDEFTRVIAACVEVEGVGELGLAHVTAIYVLSILNAVDRWYDDEGSLTRDQMASHMFAFVRSGLSGV